MIRQRNAAQLVWLLAIVVTAQSGAGQIKPQELVTNPQFRVESGQVLPGGWSAWKPPRCRSK